MLMSMGKYFRWNFDHLHVRQHFHFIVRLFFTLSVTIFLCFRTVYCCRNVIKKSQNDREVIESTRFSAAIYNLVL